MSAFLVSNATIHRCVAAIAVEGENRDSLGVGLINMNLAALRARYGDRDFFEEEMGAPAREMMKDYRWREPKTHPRRQDEKSLNCFLYQCAEGDVPQSWGLYARVMAAVDRLRALYGDQDADYRAAAWNEKDEEETV